MIRTETIGNTIYTYSDAGMKIHGGFPEEDYEEAYDPADSGRVYVETDIPAGDAADTDFIAALENLGVKFNEKE